MRALQYYFEKFEIRISKLAMLLKAWAANKSQIRTVFKAAAAMTKIQNISRIRKRYVSIVSHGLDKETMSDLGLNGATLEASASRGASSPTVLLTWSGFTKSR